MKNSFYSRRADSQFSLPAAVVWVAAILTAVPAASRAAEPLRLMPESAAVYVELAQPETLLNPLLSAKANELLQGVEVYQKYLKSQEYSQLQAVVGILEAKLGVDWQAAVRDLVGGGVYLAFDPANNSAILVSRCRKPELLTKINSTLIELVEADAKANSRPSPVKSKEYNGVVAWQFGPAGAHAIIDDLFLASNQPDALKGVIDRYRDASAKSLSDSSVFQQANRQKQPGALGWAWVSLDVVRKAPQMEKALSNRSGNPLIELLVGGVLDAVKQAPFAAAGVYLEGNTLRLRAELPRDAAKTAAARGWFFAKESNQQAPAALLPPQSIANFGLFRDLAGLWLAREELFDEKVVAGFAQADTQLGLFFSGRDFGPEVLGELDPRLQFIVARQEFSPEQPIPALKLPAMALVLRVKHPEEFATHLLVAYQKIVGLANIVGGQQGQPQLLLATEDYHGATISKATYVQEAKAAKDQAKVNYNFSPSCVRVGDAFVYASTIGIARQLVDLLAQPDSTAATSVNTSLNLIGEPLAATLADNRELMISQNMLSEGRSRAEAETAIDAILKLVRVAEKADLKLLAQPDSLALEATVQVRGE